MANSFGPQVHCPDQLLRFQLDSNATFFEACRAEEVTIPPLCSKKTPLYDVIHLDRPYGSNLISNQDDVPNFEEEDSLGREFHGPEHFRFEDEVSLMDRGCETWILDQLQPTIHISQWYKINGEMSALKQEVYLLNEYNQPIYETDEDLTHSSIGSWKQHTISIPQYPPEVFHVRIIVWGIGEDTDSACIFGSTSVKLVFEEHSHSLADELIADNQAWFLQCQEASIPLPKLSSDCFLPDFEDLFNEKIPWNLDCQAEHSGSLVQGSRLLNQKIDQVFSRGFINLVVIGKTGVGKSSSLNSVLKYAEGTPMMFKEDNSAESCTKAMEYREIVFSGQNIRLIDTVGLFDTELDQPDESSQHAHDQDSEHMKVLMDLARVINMCSLDGVHGFLLVFEGGQRLTMENKEAVGVIIRNLGLNVLDYVTFLITHKDKASESSLVELKDSIVAFLAQHNYDARDEQFVYFDNKARHHTQVDQLIYTVERNLTEKEHIPYQHDLFIKAQHDFEAQKQHLVVEAEAELRRKIQEATDKLEVDRRSDAFRLMNSVLLLKTKMQEMTSDDNARKIEMESKIQMRQEEFDAIIRQKETEIREAVRRQEEEVRAAHQPAIEDLQNRLEELNRQLL